MKKLLIATLLLTCLMAKPIHHRINDYLHDEGYIDRWSWSHAETGVIKGIMANVYIAVANRYGFDYPSAIRMMGYNLALVLLWETVEFGVEGHWNWSEYQKMYNGKALQNNGMDVFLDMFAFSVPLWDNIYWELKVMKHDGLMTSVSWAI